MCSSDLLEFLQLPIRALRGGLRDHVRFESFCEPDVTIETGARQTDVALDGELKTIQTPLRFSIRRGVLATLVPADV